MKQKLVIGLLLIGLAGCRYFKKSEPMGQPVARVFDKYLYESDLKGVVAPGTSSTDSIEVVKNYINNWIRQELLVHHAEANLPNDQKDFTNELEAYRRSLIIYKFETEYIKQKFDTIIPEAEIKKYYNDNKDNFKLRENICKAVWAKFPRSIPKASLAKISKIFNKGAINKLAEACSGKAINYDFSDTAWVSFDELTLHVPIKTDNPENYLRTHNFTELHDSAFIYLIRFTNVQNRESISPLDFERENIRNLLLNKRRLDVLDKLEKDLFDKAGKNKDYEILTSGKSNKRK
ncbi:MAG: hypothetical protein Q8904_14720 [Bacteroidota bacterium]|nr:hypothetical protein [Bacteroidota bacterium]